MLNLFFKALLLSAAMLLALPVLSCSEGDTAATSSTGSSPESSNGSAADRAARLAAQTQLRNAQMAQETYYVENLEYASSRDELKKADPRLSPKVEVARGGSDGYEMSIVANDAAQTRFILKKTGSRVERVDSNGVSW